MYLSDMDKIKSAKSAPEIAASGRQKLMEAALQLAATTRSLASLGLREVARTAGLNPNTFYRHFKNFDDLGLAVIAQLSTELRQGLRERRLRAAQRGLQLSDFNDLQTTLKQAQGIIGESILLVLDFVDEHKQAYIVGIRELHGSSPALRKALREVIDGIAEDMAQDVLGALKLPLLTSEDVREISHLVIRQMTFFSLDYLERPQQREQIRQQAERFVLLLFAGAFAAKAPEALAKGGIKLLPS